MRLIPAGQPIRAGVAALALLLAPGCSSNPADAPPPTIEPAQAAVSPPVTGVPDGEVRPVGGRAQSAVFDPATASLAVLGPGPDGQSMVTLVAGTQPPRTVLLPATASTMAGDSRGGLVLATRGGYFRVDIAAGKATKITVAGEQDTDFTAITLRTDGKAVLGSADGAVYTLNSPDTVGAKLKIFARVDELATQGNTTVVLDRGQTSVTEVDVTGTKAEQALRAGDGATTMAVDPHGRVLVADTRGDELLVFSTDPLIMRQRYPVRAAPYGLVGTSRLAWVSQTADNTVIGYDLDTGIPVEKVRYRTVQQPNSLAYDDKSGTLYVVSGSGAGVQVIPHAGG
ncbi:YncE family protein [Mycobacterium dioxanotrophicus]|uniref:YncE family protein n=1 Tax=Mycobacterium dioxanotrophicus TaxID=482462 RepID=UPI0018DF7BEA